MVAPKLRFKEFSGDWEKKILEHFAKIERGKFSIRPRNDPKYFGGEMPFIQTGDISNSDIYLRGFNQTLNPLGINVSKVFPKDTILITIAANIGDTAITPYAVACTDSVVAIQVNQTIANTLFIKNTIDLKKDFLDSQATQNAQKNINLQTLKPLEIYTPSLAEQTKIANFLTQVDQKIEQLTQKHELLTQYKKGMMQKLFSQHIRFKADDGSEFGEWAKISLDDISDHVGGTALEKYVTTTNTHKFISIGNYSTDGKYIDNGQRILCNKVTSTKRLNKNDLVMILNDKTISGDLIGSTILIESDDTFIYNQRSQRIISNNEKVLPKYLWCFLNSENMRSEIRKRAQGGTQIYINFSSILNIRFLLPTLPEQTKIANFLSSIDQKIDLTHQQLQQAKQWKKGLLQHMFV